MRAALIGVAAALAVAAPMRAPAGPPGAGTALALAERQVVTLEFDRPVSRVAVTDPELLSVRTRGSRVELGALKGGRGSIEIAFEDGATVAYDVAVAAARRPAFSGGSPAAIALGIGEERRFRSPGAARVLVEENGVARVKVDGETLTVVGVSPGTTSIVIVDGAGARTTWAVAVR
ncbi:MAG TPA: pilus assembly protein N-terminal domain-containing protein [Anaeromyxobacter sp.]|nr:pilus assembly protein N-terminal domain-containing protein [Anaeromyxobacter sp.]